MPKEMPGIGLVYELQEVAEQLGASKFTVLRHYRRGNMPGRKIGRRILFTGDAIKAFLESGSPTRRGQGPQADQRPATPPPTTREQGDMIEQDYGCHALGWELQGGSSQKVGVFSRDLA
jgi:excisionase family DNA binding protein